MMMMLMVQHSAWAALGKKGSPGGKIRREMRNEKGTGGTGGRDMRNEERIGGRRKEYEE